MGGTRGDIVGARPDMLPVSSKRESRLLWWKVNSPSGLMFFLGCLGGNAHRKVAESRAGSEKKCH